MRADLEFEAEMEAFMNQLSESLEAEYEWESESEYEWEGEGAQKIPAGHCTPLGTRVGSLTCTDADRGNIENLLQMSIPPDTLQSAVESSAAGAVSLATRAATALIRTNRNSTIRSTFCEAFGVLPEFVPPWRATLKGVVRWKDLGELVAIRMRDVAKIVDGGCIRYFCWGSAAHCPECTHDPSTYFACSSFQGRYIICLGSFFWQAWRDGDTATAQSTLLHEALHIYFRRTVGDSGRSGNANCYERFAVRLQNLPLSSATASNCAAGACAI